VNVLRTAALAAFMACTLGAPAWAGAGDGAGTLRVAPRLVPVQVTAYGVVHAEAESVLSAKLLARVVTIPVREGDTIHKGDLLAELDHRDLDADLKVAKAALARAEAARTEAESQFNRVERLLKQGTATNRDLEQATSANTQARAAVTEANAQVSRMETLISYARILAPFDGRFVERLVEVGEMATPGTPLLRVESSGHTELWADLPQSELDRVTVDDPATVTVHGINGPLSGRVTRIVPAADPRSHTFTVKVVLDANPTLNRVYSGMFGQVSIAHGHAPAVLVPDTAILHRSEVTGVYVVDGNGTPRLRLVRPGRRVGSERVILSGLSGGETILVDATEGARARAAGQGEAAH